jgi:hypothetical protein
MGMLTWAMGVGRSRQLGMAWVRQGTMLHSFRPRRAGGKYAEEGPMGETPDYLVWHSRTTCEGRTMPGLEEDLEES